MSKFALLKQPPSAQQHCTLSLGPLLGKRTRDVAGAHGARKQICTRQWLSSHTGGLRAYIVPHTHREQHPCMIHSGGVHVSRLQCWLLLRTAQAGGASPPAPFCAAADRTAAHTATAVANSESVQQLRAWIEDNGGYVHPALELATSPSHGCRGIIATEDIPAELCAEEPLILLPERLVLSTDVAQKELAAVLAFHELTRFKDRTDPVLPLALLLARERGKGAKSFWAPYLQLLPDQPGNGWNLEGPALAAAIRQAQQVLGSAADEFPQEAQRANKIIQDQADSLAAAMSKELEISAADIRWGMGQVLSRCFGAAPSVGLLPFIDLCNHAAHGAPPDSYEGAVDGEPFIYVPNTHFDEPVGLKAGQELFISYLPGGTPPLFAFLNLGFVPEECAQQLTEDVPQG